MPAGTPSSAARAGCGRWWTGWSPGSSSPTGPSPSTEVGSAALRAPLPGAGPPPRPGAPQDRGGGGPRARPRTRWGKRCAPGRHLPSVSACPLDYQSEYYGPGSNYDFFPQGPPSSQAQTPVELPFVPSSGPPGTPLGALEHPLPGHHPSSEAQRFPDIMAHPPGDSPSPEPNLPGSLHSMSAEVFGPSPPFSSLSVNGGANYGNHLSHPPEMNEAAVW